MAQNADSLDTAVDASCPGQEWVIRNLSALKENFSLSQFMVDGLEWYIELEPGDNKLPGIYLKPVTQLPSTMRVHFSLKIVDQLKPDQSIDREYDKLFEPELWSWGWSVAVSEPLPPGVILDDKLVFKTHVRVSQDLSPGSADGPLLEESHNFLTRACVQLYKGNNTSEPDVLLNVEDAELPAHRSLLAESSDVFRAMFKSGMSESGSKIVDIQEIAVEDMKIILKFVYGVLDALPEERLHSLVLATDRLQSCELMERCITQLKRRLNLDTFVDTAVFADRVNHQGLRQACVDFTLQEENRSSLGKHIKLKCALEDAPDFAFKLIGDILEHSVPKKAQTDQPAVTPSPASTSARDRLLSNIQNAFGKCFGRGANEA